MALFRYPSSAVWWYDFRFDGQRIRESTKSRSKTVAKDAERARRRQLEERYNGVATRERPRVLSAAAEDSQNRRKGSVSDSTLKIDDDALRLHVLPVFGRKLVTDFSAEELKDYQRRRLAEGASPRSINIELGALRQILIRNNCWEKIRRDFRMLPVPESPGIALSRTEERKTLQECKRSNSMSLFYAVLMALCTGLRRSEIRFLRWFQVDLNKRVIAVGVSKTRQGRGRRIPINRRLLSALRIWAQRFPMREPQHFVFPRERYGYVGHRFEQRKEKAYGTDPTRPFGSWKTAWKAAKRRAGLKCRFHDLRHTACTRMLEGGTPFAVVASIMGWSPATTIQMAKRYGHLERSFTKAVALLDDSRQRRRKQSKRPSSQSNHRGEQTKKAA